MGLDKLISLPLLPILYFLLYTFRCRRSFLLVFRSFLSIVALQIIVTLVCPWEEVSSGFSYFAIMVTPLHYNISLHCIVHITVH